jgi:hypothetical protein
MALDQGYWALLSPGCRESFRDRREYVHVACGRNIRVSDAREKIPAIRGLSRGTTE